MSQRCFRFLSQLADPALVPIQWQLLLPTAPLGPSSRHLFRLSAYSDPLTHLKLTMHPDGGIARFRAYGRVISSLSRAASDGAVADLAHVLNGGRATGESDQHFGKGSNLLLPGRGHDMGDGWETRRSEFVIALTLCGTVLMTTFHWTGRGRLETGGGDWVVIKLQVVALRCARGYLLTYFYTVQRSARIPGVCRVGHEPFHWQLSRICFTVGNRVRRGKSILRRRFQ